MALERSLPVKRKTNIQKRRRLSALYERGKEVRFGPDEDGNPRSVRVGPFAEDDKPADDDIVVWLTPPNPLQRDQALREAQARRARFMVVAHRQEDSSNSMISRALVTEMELATLIDYVLATGESERQQEATRDVQGNKEWDDYTALQDSIRQWREKGEPEGEEWDALLARDREYGDQLRKRLDQLRESSRESLEMMPRETLEERASRSRMEMLANQEFMVEYEAQMLFYACRDDEDHSDLFFESVEELQQQAEEVQQALADVLAEFISDEAEAKNSQGAESGLDSSTPPSEPETTDPSIPETVNA